MRLASVSSGSTGCGSGSWQDGISSAGHQNNNVLQLTHLPEVEVASIKMNKSRRPLLLCHFLQVAHCLVLSNDNWERAARIIGGPTEKLELVLCTNSEQYIVMATADYLPFLSRSDRLESFD
jgi:hypothetical protein